MKWLIILMVGLWANTASAEQLKIVMLDYYPYSYHEDGQNKGVSVNIVNAIFEKTGIEHEVVILPWSRAIYGMENGQYDVMTPMFYTKEREKLFNFSALPIQTFDMVLFRKNDQITFPEFNEPKDFSGLSIIKVINTVTADIIEQAIDQGHLVSSEVADIDNQIRMVQRGRADFAVGDMLTGMLKIQELGMGQDVKPMLPAIQSRPVFIAYNKGLNPQIIEKVNETIYLMDRTGELKALMQDSVKAVMP